MKFVFNRLPTEAECESGYVILTDHNIIGLEVIAKNFASWDDFSREHGCAYDPATGEQIALGWAALPKGPVAPSKCLGGLAAFAFEVANAKLTEQLTLKRVTKLMRDYGVVELAEECERGFNEMCLQGHEIYHDVEHEGDVVRNAFDKIAEGVSW